MADDKKNETSNQMWGGRFASGPDAIMEEINASIDYDRKLFRQDIRGSLAHAVIWFHASVLERAILDKDRDLARVHMDALTAFASDEPIGSYAHRSVGSMPRCPAFSSGVRSAYLLPSGGLAARLLRFFLIARAESIELTSCSSWQRTFHCGSCDADAHRGLAQVAFDSSSSVDANGSRASETFSLKSVRQPPLYEFA